MEQEAHERSLITWVVGLGVLLVIVVGASGYVIANPESMYRLFGGTVPIAAKDPVKAVNGPVAVIKEQPAHTKHYASIFFEFDYPENFVIVSELINATRTPSGESSELFGSAEVLLSSTGTDATYTLRVTSTVNQGRISVEDASRIAKDAFSSRPDRGANDSFQDITVIDRPAYKNFTGDRIHIGIPTGNLNYAAEMTWDPAFGVRSTANNYLGIIEDSFTVK